MVGLRQCVASFGTLILFASSVLAEPASAQQAPASTPPQEVLLDPTSPMADLPDIGVAWPDMKAAEGDESALQKTPEDAERRYSVAVEGLDRLGSTPVRERFDRLSALRQGQEKPANIAQIDRRTREDQELLETILRTSGYYDADVETEVEQAAAGDIRVRFRINPGPLYRFADVTVDGLDGTGAKAPDYAATFGVDKDDAVDADDVVGGQTALQKSLIESGFPFAKVSEPEVVVDHESRSATLAMKVDAGGQRTFGQIRLKSDYAPFDAKHVSRIARFKSGETFNQTKLEDLRRALVATGLAGSVDLVPVPGVVPGTADIEVGLEKAPVRTIAAEAGYGTGEGARLEASWTHRNLIRPEGALTVRGIAGTREQLAGLLFRQSNFSRRDHVLNARLQASNIVREAFDARTVEVGASLERQSNIIWQKRWTWSVGAELIATDERDITFGQIARRQTFLIGSLPLSVGYDRSDDLLDPTKGFRLGLRVAPEISLRNGSKTYLRAQLDGSAYAPVSKRVVLAGRMRFGSVFGAKSFSLAPSRRFYAGGGGSVRGFGYQAIGPRDPFNDPVGGRSLAELSLEARIRFGAFGVVPFMDAGNIFDGRLPKLSGFRYGAGLGFRYHSSFGPIRVDVGTPINPQPGDTRITVFVSLGQAF